MLQAHALHYRVFAALTQMAAAHGRSRSAELPAAQRFDSTTDVSPLGFRTHLQEVITSKCQGLIPSIEQKTLNYGRPTEHK